MSELAGRAAMVTGASIAARQNDRLPDSVSRNSPPVIIAGMHRSGTSMVSRLLRDCGVYLGKEDSLAGSSADNENGFWENLRLVQVNEAVLAELGASWDLPLPFPEDWMDNEQLFRLRLRADLATKALRRSDFWGWKDPRNSLTLPFWRTLFPQMRVVICVRNPFEVALSLRKRNNTSNEMGLTLWAIYNQRLLEATSPQERVVTHYDAYFHQPQSELRRVAEFLGVRISDEELRQSTSSVKPESRHNSFGADHLIEFGASSEVISTYTALCEESGWQAGEPVLKVGRSYEPRVGNQARIAENRERLHADAAAIMTPGAPSPTWSLGRYDRAAFELELAKRDLSSFSNELRVREDRLRETEASLNASTARATSLHDALRELEVQHAALGRTTGAAQVRSLELAELRLDSLEQRFADNFEALSNERATLLAKVEALVGDRAHLAEERDGFFKRLGYEQRRATELEENLSRSEEAVAAMTRSYELLRQQLAAVHRSRLWRIGRFYWRMRDRLGLGDRM